MSGRPRQSGQYQSQEQQRIWKPSDRQVESDSERPRQSSSKSRRDPSDPRYHTTSSRGYTSDSPATASNQYRSATTSTKTLHHPSRPSISSNTYVPRSQQPVASTSTTPAPAASQSQAYHSRSHAQRSQPEAQDPRLYSHKRTTSTPTPQSSYERVPTTDEFGGRTSRTKAYVRASHTTPAPQAVPPPEIWLPSSQEPPSSSRRHRERESEREKERDRDRTRERPRESSDRRREREPEKQDEETYRDRDRVRERPRESSDRRKEREPEKRDEEAYREAFREAYRDRERHREKERETDRVLAERRTGREREKEKDPPNREPRSSSKAPSTRDAPEPRVREHVGSSSGHRRYRSEEAVPVTSEPRRPHQDIRRPSAELRSQAVPAPHPTPASQPTQSAPTPHGMPVYLPVNKVPSHKASQERASSTSVNAVPKGGSASDTEHTSRRDQIRANTESRPFTNTPTPRDYTSSRVENAPRATAPVTTRIGAKYQEMRAKFAGAQVKSTPASKTSELPPVQPSLDPPIASSSVLSAENRGATAKPYFTSIRAGEGPSDTPVPEPTSRKSTKSIRETRPQQQQQPPPPEKTPAVQTSSNTVRERIRSIEASLRPEKHVPRVQTTVVDESGRLESGPKTPYQPPDPPYTNQDRVKLREETNAPRAQTTVVDDSSRVESVSRPPYQPSDPPSASQDRAKIRETSLRENNLRPEVALPNPTLSQSIKSSGHSRTHAMPKTALSQPTTGSLPSRQAPSRTVRFDLPPPPESPEPHGETSSVIDQATKTYHPSRLVPDGVPFGVPVAPSSSSESRQTSTPPSPANQKLSPSQPKDRSPLQSSRVDDQQPRVPHTANLSKRTEHAQQIPEQLATQPPDVQQSSYKRGGSHQAQSDRPRFDGPPATASAPVLTTTHSQTPYTPVPQTDAVHSTPSQSTSRSTKDRDLREDNILPSTLAPQGQTPTVHTSHAIDPRPSRQTRSGVATASGQEHFSGRASKPPTTSALPPSLQGAPLTSSQGRSTKDTRSSRRDQYAQASVEEVHDLPPSQSVPPKTAANDPIQVNPPALQPQPAEPYSIRSFATTSQPTASVAPKVPELLYRVEDDGAAQPARDRPSHLNTGEHSKYKDARSARQKIPMYGPALTTQPSIEESRQTIKAEGPRVVPTDSTELADSPAPLPVLLRQNTGADEPTRHKEVLGERETPELQTYQHIVVPSTVTRATSNSVPRPEMVHEPVKPERGLSDEDTLHPKEVFDSHRQIRENKNSRDSPEDMVLLRTQLNEGRPSHTTTTVPSRLPPPEDAAKEAASRAVPSKNWYQSTKYTDPRPSKVDLPLSAPTMADRSESASGHNSQSTASRTAVYIVRPEDPAPRMEIAATPSAPGFLQDSPSSQSQWNASAFTSNTKHPIKMPSVEVTSQPLITDTPVPQSEPRSREHQVYSGRQTSQNGVTAPAAASERQHVETYDATSGLSTIGTTPPQDNHLRFPLVEDSSSRPGIAQRQERVKFQYAPSPAPDPHQGLLSPVQQAIRAIPTPQVAARSLSYETQNNSASLRGQPIPSVTPSQSTYNRTQPQPNLAAPALITPSSSLSQPSSSSAAHNIPSSYNPSLHNPSRPDDSTAATRTTTSSGYPSSSTYPSAVYQSELQSSYSQSTSNALPARPLNGARPESSQPTAYPTSTQYSQISRMPESSRLNIPPRNNDSTERLAVNPQPTAYPTSAQHQVPRMPESSRLNVPSRNNDSTERLAVNPQPTAYPTSAQHQVSRMPESSRPTIPSRSNDSTERLPVNPSVTFPNPGVSISAAPVQPLSNTHHRNVSLTHPSQPNDVTPSNAVQPPKPSVSSTNPPHNIVPSTPVGSLYHLQPDAQQTSISTRVPASGYIHSPTPIRPSLPQRHSSRNGSNESLLQTPSSLAPSMLPRTPSYTRPSIPMPPVTRQESRDSRDSTKRKNAGFLGRMFRAKTPTPTPKSYEPVQQQPSGYDQPKEANHSQSSLQSTSKVPAGSRNINVNPPASQRRAPAPITVDIPLHPTSRKEPEQKVFSAFKFLHGPAKRTRTMSKVSLEAQDGQTHTATNTVVGSPTQSAISQTPGPFVPPPLRDPYIATQEWTDKEEADNRRRAKGGRRKPGVTFDVDLDEPLGGKGGKKKLSRTRRS